MIVAILMASLMATSDPAPLVPDGATLMNAEGRLVRPEPGDPWNLRLTATPGDDRTQDFVLMPSQVLEDMERMQAKADGPIAFVVTGDVSLFDGRNWLMPRHAEALTTHAHRDVPSVEPADPGEPDDTDMRPGASEGDSIEDIVADLQSSIKTLPRTLDSGSDQANPQDPLDGTLIHARRGRLLRGRHGAWVFVFDADAWGQGDPPAVLLPSPMLQKLVRQGQRADYRKPIHLSGVLTTYRGRRFLTPTAVTPLHERPNLGR
ncbi:MAG: hypothetical protein QF733_09435 [Phycisphaerales bacterium]|jgi:hypothetical protein|nr:hypothetical protein [Phycisphaerales bacterium]